MHEPPLPINTRVSERERLISRKLSEWPGESERAATGASVGLCQCV